RDLGRCSRGRCNPARSSEATHAERYIDPFPEGDRHVRIEPQCSLCSSGGARIESEPFLRDFLCDLHHRLPSVSRLPNKARGAWHLPAGLRTLELVDILSRPCREFHLGLVLRPHFYAPVQFLRPAFRVRAGERATGRTPISTFCKRCCKSRF